MYPIPQWLQNQIRPSQPAQTQSPNWLEQYRERQRQRSAANRTRPAPPVSENRTTVPIPTRPLLPAQQPNQAELARTYEWRNGVLQRRTIAPIPGANYPQQPLNMQAFNNPQVNWQAAQTASIRNIALPFQNTMRGALRAQRPTSTPTNEALRWMRNPFLYEPQPVINYRGRPQNFRRTGVNFATEKPEAVYRNWKYSNATIEGQLSGYAPSTAGALTGSPYPGYDNGGYTPWYDGGGGGGGSNWVVQGARSGVRQQAGAPARQAGIPRWLQALVSWRI